MILITCNNYDIINTFLKKLPIVNFSLKSQSTKLTVINYVNNPELINGVAADSAKELQFSTKLAKYLNEPDYIVPILLKYLT